MDEASMRILIVEDDPEAAHFMAKGLRELGHVVDHAEDGEDGYALGREGGYDVLVIDRMLPRMEGLTVVERLRGDGVETPILILSALGKVDDRVKGLRAGGDDYLVKPYAFSELEARIEALVRRRDPRAVETTLKVGSLEMDLLSREVRRDGKVLELLPREFRILEYLMKNAGRVVTRTMLLENVWEYHFDPQTNVIDVHMSRLRAKLDKGFEMPMLETVRGAGYRLKALDA